MVPVLMLRFASQSTCASNQISQTTDLILVLIRSRHPSRNHTYSPQDSSLSELYWNGWDKMSKSIIRIKLGSRWIHFNLSEHGEVKLTGFLVKLEPHNSGRKLLFGIRYSKQIILSIIKSVKIKCRTLVSRWKKETNTSIVWAGLNGWRENRCVDWLQSVPVSNR